MNNIPNDVHYSEPFQSDLFRYYTFFGNLKFKRGLYVNFRIITLFIKRLFIAFMIATPFDKDTKIILLLLIQIAYICFKCYARPYSRNFLMVIRLFGDCAYLVAIILFLSMHF